MEKQIVDLGMHKQFIELEVFNPRGEITPPPVFGLSPRITDFKGKKIALVDSRKAGADLFLDAVEELLKQRFPGVVIVRLRKPEGVISLTPRFYPEVAAGCDAFIWATGD
jgi:hypothetical protein